VSSGFIPPCVSQWSFRNLRRSSWTFIWLRVSFFFLTTGIPSLPFSAPLPAGVALADTVGVWTLERTGVFAPLPFLPLNASSIRGFFPLCVTLPASTFQISGPTKHGVGQKGGNPTER